MSIKYYHLANDEELPEEFCAVRDIGGEPSEYTFYVPETENAKLRELASVLRRCLGSCLSGEDCEDDCPMLDADGWCNRDSRLREMGIEVEEQ